MLSSFGSPSVFHIFCVSHRPKVADSVICTVAVDVVNKDRLIASVYVPSNSVGHVPNIVEFETVVLPNKRLMQQETVASCHAVVHGSDSPSQPLSGGGLTR